MKHIEKSQYTSAAGNQVTLYRNTKTNECLTLINGDITLYNSDGDMTAGATSLEAGLKYIGALSEAL